MTHDYYHSDFSTNSYTIKYNFSSEPNTHRQSKNTCLISETKNPGNILQVHLGSTEEQFERKINVKIAHSLNGWNDFVDFWIVQPNYAVMEPDKFSNSFQEFAESPETPQTRVSKMLNFCLDWEQSLDGLVLDGITIRRSQDSIILNTIKTIVQELETK